MTSYKGEQFGQRRPPLSVTIKSILERYPDGQIFKEMIQNADDAGAKTVQFFIDSRQHGTGSLVHPDLAQFQGPALIAANDASFSDADWEGIQRLQQSIKAEDPFKVGRFGIGFNSVYHITDVPTIISGEKVAYLDPQERIWPGESGRLFKLANLQGSDALVPFNGIAGFNFEGITSCSSTLFRFPLRSACSDLSENIYNAQKLQKLIDALRLETKYLLLFLRSVNKVEVYHISQGGFHTLSFKVQIASKNQEEVNKKRSTFMDQLRHAHKSQPFGITTSISFAANFEIEVTDNNPHNNQSGCSSWLVANSIGSQNGTVISVAKKQHLFPWVGISLQLPSGHGQNPSGGRIYCFLPLPIEALSNLPVNVNGTFSLNDERRTLKWPGRERTNDQMAEWNRLLVTQLLPHCYALLLEKAMKCLNPDQYYSAWPDVRRIRGSEWEGVVRPLLNILFTKNCIWSSLTKQWVHHSHATFIPESTTLLQVVKRVLTACSVKLVEIPSNVWNAIDYQNLRKALNLVTPNVVRREMRRNTVSYTNESRDSKLDLLSYCLSDQNYSDLLGLHLLPLANGTFVSFRSLGRRTTILYLCSEDYPRSLLPNIEHLLIDISDRGELLGKLNKVAISGKTQLQTLSVQGVANLLPHCFPHEWNFKQSQTVSLPSPSFPSDWFPIFWNWVRQHNLSHFANLPVVPLAVRDTRHGFKVTKLVQSMHSSVVYISEDCSVHLLSALNKLQVQCTIFKHVNYLQHRQLSLFLNRLNPTDVLTAIANANDYINASFSTTEAFELQRFLAPHMHLSLNGAQQNVLKNLKLFTSVNKQGLYSAVQASNNSWRNRAVKEPLGITISSQSLPSNLVVLSNENYQTTLLQQCNQLVIMPTTLLNFILEVAFPMIKCGSFPEGQLDSFMKEVLQLFQVLKQQDQNKGYWNTTGSFVTELTNLPFLKSSQHASRTPPNTLYDPLSTEIRNLFEGEPVFPIEPFNQEKHVYYLRQCGLQVSVAANKLFDILNSVSVHKSLVPQKIGSTQMTRIKAVLSYISKHATILQETVRLNGWNHTLAQALQTIAKQKCFFPVSSNPPENYPQCLPWKGSKYSSHVVANDSSALIKKSELDGLPHITGSQMYIVETPSNLHPLFASEVPIDCVIAHFKLIIQQSKHIEPTSLDLLVHKVYTFMSENIKRLASANVDLRSQDCQWIWLKHQQVFVSSNTVVIQKHRSFEYNLTPYFYQLPYELKNYSRLFLTFGVHKQLSDSQIVAVLKSIKEDSNVVRVPAQQAWRMVEHILTWLTDGGDSLASSKLKANEQLYVPIESTLERPQLMEVEKVVYTDLDFLKSFNISVEGMPTNTFIHHKVAHLAKSLRVTPLSTHLNIAEDAFGDVGQYEPLVTRLKNILRDYKDGLTIIKELLQNADDAEATELNICYDARTHETDSQKLFFPGMSKCHGPALVVHNNAVFTEEDFENITKLAGATKQNKPLKIGKFGVGFCSVYHITDVPSFISRDWLYIFDPTLEYLKEEIRDRSRPGKKLRFTERLVSHSKQLQPYLNLYGFQQNKPYQGTLFRFPFRTSTSDISGLRYDNSHVNQLVSDIKEAGSKLLLFLKNIKRITMSQIRNGDSETTLLLEIKKRESSTVISETPSLNDSCSAMIKQVSISSTATSYKSFITTKVESWLVSSHSTLLDHSKYATASIACVLKESSAVDITDDPIYNPEKVTGELFCFLPIALETGLPIHVSSNFAVLNDRSGIHSSHVYHTRQSEEDQWNMKLMIEVIPKAYHTLLLAVQKMCLQGTVPVDEYPFYLLWPLNESLKTHHPWDHFLPVLYRLVSESKLFYSTCTEKWLPLRECRILSPDILSCREPTTPESVIAVIESLHYPLIYFPSSVKNQFAVKDITSRVLNEEEFLTIFFRNISSVAIATRNNVLCFLLEACAATTKDYMSRYIKGNSCVPCTPNGIQLKMCSKVVDPCREVSQLFHQDDGMFPIDEFHKNTLIHATLVKSGMMCDTLPWHMLVDRAQNITIIHSTDFELAMKRVALLIKCIDDKLLHSSDSLSSIANFSQHETPLPVDASQLTSIKFLPVTQKPKNYPIRLNWGGKNRKLLNSQALLKCYNSTYLVGSQVSIVCESSLKVGGCFDIPTRVCKSLDIKTKPSCMDVVNHLCHIIHTYSNIVLDEQEKKWIEKSCESINGFFEMQLSWKVITEQDLVKLTLLPSIWTGNEFIKPESVASNWTHDGPFLYGIPHLLKAKNNLIRAMRIQEQFSIEQMLHALKQMHDKFKTTPLGEREMKIIPELALELQKQLGDSQLKDYQICYLPNENRIMHETSQLTYNDAEWCSVDQECQFVHSTVPTQAAVKLRVKLVRAKALEKYESTTQNFAGLPFGQREDLTQRIKNILADYPCDITVIKELLQNADDAKATKMYIILDERSHDTKKLPKSEWKDLQGPALLVWNDKGFSDADFEGIQKLGLGSKRSNLESIGQFGIGFNVVYHLTDCPSFFTNGNTLCVFDPHCRYVPGANHSMPGRQYNNLDAEFWKKWFDLKAPYLQEKLEGCPNEVSKEGTLFRFPLRHRQELVDQSELINEFQSFKSTDTLLPAWKMREYLSEWAPKMKESLTFLNHVTELKFFVIDIQSRMILTHHYKVSLNELAITSRRMMEEKARLFTETRHEPYVVSYPLSLCEEVPKKVVEHFLIQQGVGDLQNPDQHWKYLSQLKPKHGIAARTDDVHVHGLKGKVFCFLPLPLESRLPVHVNGNFILDAARSGLWQSRDTREADDRKKWNLRLIEAIASSYVNFLVNCRNTFVSSQLYENIQHLWNDIRSYYSIFPNWECKEKPEGEMKLLAELVYKGLHKLNSEVLVAFHTTHTSKDCSKLMTDSKSNKTSYKTEWIQLLNEGNPSKQAYFWDKPTEVSSEDSLWLKSIPSILKSIGMHLTAAPMKLQRHFSSVEANIPQATPLSAYKYYSDFYTKTSPNGSFPCYLKHTSFRNVGDFLSFTLYVMESTSPEDETGIHYKFPEPGPFGLPLLLTADEQLRVFSEGDKVIRTAYSNLFQKMKGQFLHPSMTSVKYVKTYFLEPAKENWPLIQNILEVTLPQSLHHNGRLHNAGQRVDTDGTLKPFWRCLLSDPIFSIHLTQILNEWAILLTNGDELFACKSNDQLLPAIAPYKLQKDILAKSTSYSDLPLLSSSEAMLEAKVYEVMQHCAMPILNITVCYVSLCKDFCPQFSQPSRILTNLYFLFNNGEVTVDTFFKSKIDTFCEYFGRIHFAQDNGSVLKVKALPLFQTIDNEYSVITSETYILPNNVCLAGKGIWLKSNGTVILRRDGEWRKLGPASLLGIKEVSALFAYTKLIFPLFHLLTDEHRIYQLKHIRDTPELFDLAKNFSQHDDDDDDDDDDSEQKEESVEFISALKELRCIEANGALRHVRDFCDPTKKIFKTFPESAVALPETFVTEDNKWLKFFRQIGLKSELTKEEFTKFCHTVSSGNHQNLQLASNDLLTYLFNEKDWHKDHQFLKRVSAIPFVCAEPLEKLSWIVPTVRAETTIQQRNITLHLTKLTGAANYEYCNLVWTVLPVVSLPDCYQYLFRDEIEKFHKALGICTIPTPSHVIQNILNIAKTRFTDFSLFEEYSHNCKPNFETRRRDFLFGVLSDNFHHLSLLLRRNYQWPNYEVQLSHLENAPCIPVSNTGESDKVASPVLVKPIQVVASDVKRLVPFINPLPDRLYQYLPGVLAEIGVKKEIQICHVTMALEQIKKYTEPPFDPNTVTIVKCLLKQLYLLLKNTSLSVFDDRTLYLPSKEGRLLPSTLLLYDDTGSYKQAKFDFSHINFSMASLLTNKLEELNEFGFQLNEFCALLPKNVRPLPFSTSCSDKLHDRCIPQQIHSHFAQQLKMAFGRSGIGKCVKLILQRTSTSHAGSVTKFANSLDEFCKSVQVITVADLTVDLYLEVVKPPHKIGTAKVHFSLHKETEGIRLYVDENAHPGFYNLFEVLTSTITECVVGMSGIDRSSLNKPEKALEITLKASSAEELAYILNDLGINTTQLKLTDTLNTELTPKLGAPIPEQWIHRLKSSINNVFKPQEWVGFEVRDDCFIFAQILYHETQTVMVNNQDEDSENDVDDAVNLPLFRIRTQEDDDKGITVSIIELYKILRIRQVSNDDGSTEITLFDPESEGVHLWDAVKDEKLKDIMRKICDELRQIQKIKDKDQRRKAQKALYLKYHPDKNNNIFAGEAVQFLRRQITRLANDLPLEDPEDLEHSPAPPSDPKCEDLFESWNNTAEKHNKAWQAEQSSIERHQRGDRFGGSSGLGATGGLSAFGGFGASGGLGGWNWERAIQVLPEPQTAVVWLEQAKWDLTALQLLVAQTKNIEKVSAHACFLAHQVAEKALKAGMYKQFGLHPEYLRTHFLTGLAGALQQLVPLTSPSLREHASRLEPYYLYTRYPNKYNPPAVPSFNFDPSDAKQAENAAASIFEAMNNFVNH